METEVGNTKYNNPQTAQKTPRILQRENARNDHSHILGWGADLDHKNRPAEGREEES
jgi:hypothetical protein